MAVSKVSKVRIAGIASAVPEQSRSVFDDGTIFGSPDVVKISQATGVKSRHIADQKICTSDLCYAAAERLLGEAGWEKSSIDTIIFVSQTPDYRLPATACVLQHRLGLSTESAAFDVNMGCTGYVYGLWLSSSLINSGCAKHVLLLVGDTLNKFVSPKDRSVALLFGDAGTATLLERSDSSQPMTFVMGTDGVGAKNLIIPAGGFRCVSDDASRQRIEKENGNFRSEEDLFMNGAEIFTFTLNRVTPMIKKLLEETGLTPDIVDFFVFHQANKFIVNHLAKKMKLPANKVPLCLENFGNTSSASIPLTITESLAPALKNEELKLVLAGFGVGYSWGAAALNIGPIPIPNLILVK